MELVAILFLLGCGFAAKAAWEHVRADFRQSRSDRLDEVEKAHAPEPLPKSRRRQVARHHAAGYWTREVLGGFPVTRTGMHAGWLAHRTATQHVLNRREEARTTSLETQATVRQSIAEHRERQRQAREQINEIIAQADPAPRTPEQLDEAVEDAGGVVIAGPWAGTLGAPNPDAPSPDDTADSASAGGGAADEKEDAGPEPGTSPERTGGRRHSPDWTAAHPAGGTTVVATTEFTYTDQIRASDQIIAEAEAEIARLRARRAMQWVDALTSMGLDSASLGDAAAIDDALRAQMKAAQDALEAAQTFKANLAKRHGGIQEAVSDAPVRGAEREFYEGQ